MKAAVFTQRVEVVESYKERRDCADQRIPAFIRACGYMAVPVPNCTESLEEFLDKLSPAGIVLTGGNSLVKYGGNAPERDRTDYTLLKAAEERQIPVYGFCRGMQSILDYYGNELTEIEGHVAVRHRVCGDAGTFEVNSYHKQACLELKKEGPLQALGRAEDGVIEEIRHRTLPIAGTMWHPEREEEFAAEDIERVRKMFG